MQFVQDCTSRRRGQSLEDIGHEGIIGKWLLACQGRPFHGIRGYRLVMHSAFPKNIRRNSDSHSRTPAIKSSNRVQSPRLLSEQSPSMSTSKGFFFVEQDFRLAGGSSIAGCTSDQSRLIPGDSWWDLNSAVWVGVGGPWSMVDRPDHPEDNPPWPQ
jgi:hypothetical protein